MNFIEKNAVAMVAIVIAIVACFLPVLPSGKSLFGAVSTSCSGFTSCVSDLYVNTQGGGSGSIQTDGTVKISSTGTAINGLNAGTCVLIASSFTVAASTTVPMDCAVTGAVTGDVVFASFATSSLAGNNWTISGASASTTAGFDTFRVTNTTGVSNIIPASLASSTKYLNIR